MSERTFLLQDWVTVRSNFASANPLVQSQEGWLDMSGFADAAFWIDVAEVTPPGSANYLQLFLETAPTCDEIANPGSITQSWFQPTTGALRLGTAAPFILAAPTPFVANTVRSASTVSLSRYLRWRVVPSAAGAWDLTFRIRVVANRSGFFVPTDLAGCVLWLRADLGITLNGANVSQWADQSSSGNNASAASGHQPPYNVRQINAQPTVFFDPSTVGSEKYMTLTNSLASLTAAHAFVVHRRLSPPPNNTQTGFWKLGTGTGTPAMPGTDANIYDDCASTTPHTCGAAVVSLYTEHVYEVRSRATSWANFLNGNAQFSAATNTVGASATPQIGGNTSFPNYYNGDWAEMILFNRILTTAERTRLVNYFNGRYQLGAV